MDEDTENDRGANAVTAAAADEQEALRYRHDGWTPAKQKAFLAALAEFGSVTDACKVVGMSTTSAYRARHIVRGFRNRWADALAAARPKPEDIAYRRAVEGVQEPVYQGGKLVGHKTRYSDSLLKMMIQRGTVDTPGVVKRVPIEEVEAVLLKQLAAVEKRMRREADAARVAWADAMVARGLAP